MPIDVAWQQLTLSDPTQVRLRLDIYAHGPGDTLALTYSVWHGLSDAVVAMGTKGYALTDRQRALFILDVQDLTEQVVRQLAPF